MPLATTKAGELAVELISISFALETSASVPQLRKLHSGQYSIRIVDTTMRGPPEPQSRLSDAEYEQNYEAYKAATERVERWLRQVTSPRNTNSSWEQLTNAAASKNVLMPLDIQAAYSEAISRRKRATEHVQSNPNPTKQEKDKTNGHIVFTQMLCDGYDLFQLAPPAHSPEQGSSMASLQPSDFPPLGSRATTPASKPQPAMGTPSQLIEPVASCATLTWAQRAQPHTIGPQTMTR